MDTVQSRDDNIQGYKLPTMRENIWMFCVLDEAFQAILKYTRTVHFYEDDIGTPLFTFSPNSFLSVL